MTRHKKLVSTVLSLFVVTLAGCKSQPSPEAGTTVTPASTVTTKAKVRFDPCSVLTTAEVTAITTDAVSKTQVIGNDCHYHTTFEDDGTVIAIYPTGGTKQMEDNRKAMNLIGGLASSVSGLADVGKSAQAAGGPTAPAGAPAIGDEAFWEPNAVLAVRKGDLFVEVTPTIVHDPATHHGPMMISNANKRVISQKLAEAVLAKLAH